MNGEAGGTSAWFNDSDRRLKKNISTIDEALEKVNNLRGVNFEWKDQSKYSKGLQMGFIAQEVEQVVPEVVDPSGDHYTMQYAPLTALLVEAVKELNARNKELSAKNKELTEKEAVLTSENVKLTHQYEDLKEFEEELSLRIAKLERKNHINEVASRDSR